MNLKHGRTAGAIAALAGLCLWPGCARLKVAPVEVNVQPIHVTVDVNIKIQQVDRALDDFFSDLDAPDPAGPAAGTKDPAPPKEKQP